MRQFDLKLIMLVSEIEHDRAGLHQMHAGLMIDDRWNSVVRRDFQKVWRKLLTLRDVD